MTYGPERTDLDGFRHLLHTRFDLRRVTALNLQFWRIETKQNFAIAQTTLGQPNSKLPSDSSKQPLLDLKMSVILYASQARGK